MACFQHLISSTNLDQISQSNSPIDRIYKRIRFQQQRSSRLVHTCISQLRQTFGNMAKGLEREKTDVESYASFIQSFERQRLPSNERGWIDRAREVADILATDAPKRDIENRLPRGEIALLKAAGLTKVLGPKKYGGGGESWETGYKLIREVAKSDGSIGMLLGYHLLWSTTANVVCTEEQADSIQEVILENNWFIGGAVNPRDNDLKITSEGDELVFNGFKNFNTGQESRHSIRHDGCLAHSQQAVSSRISQSSKECLKTLTITSSRSSKPSSRACNSSTTGTASA